MLCVEAHNKLISQQSGKGQRYPTTRAAAVATGITNEHKNEMQYKGITMTVAAAVSAACEMYQYQQDSQEICIEANVETKRPI